MNSHRPAKLRFIVVVVLIATAGAAAWLRWGVVRAKPDLTHIVLISIDTCRADHLSCYRDPGDWGDRHQTTPHIDQVAREGIVFRNAVTPVPITLPAHGSMLTGTNPPYHGVHDNINYRLGPSNVTLAELLKDNGFATAAVIGAFVLDSRFGLDQGFESYHDRFDDELNQVGIPERRGEEVSRYGLQWLAEHHREPFFLFLHYYDPHACYDPPVPFKPTSASDSASLYAAEISYTDACIGQVIDQLKRLGIYDSTLIIVTSDHGEALGDHREDTHSYFIYNETLKVPLVIKPPGQHRPRQIDDLVGIIDILPTICHMRGIPVPPQVVGKDLSPYLTNSTDNPEERSYYCESWQPTNINCNSLTGILTKRWKYIQTTRPELYDLVADPRESNNLVATDPEQTRTLVDRLQRMLAEQTRADADSRLALDQQARKRIESLGYVGAGSTGESQEPDPSRDDPKDFIDFHKAYTKLPALIHRKEYAKAKALCKTLIEQRPDVLELYFQMGAIARGRQDPAAAIAHLAKAIELAPDDHRAHYNLGIALSALGRSAEAIRCYREALRANPESAEAHFNLGNEVAADGRFEEAIDHYQAAVRANPKFADAYYNLGNALKDLGQYDQAIDHYRQARRHNPDSVAILTNLAALLAITGQPEPSFKCFEELVLLDPNNATAQFNLGLSLSLQGRFKEAVEHLRQAVGIQPDYAKAHHHLGAALDMTGRPEEALVHLREAARCQPGWPLPLTREAWILATHPDAAVRDPQKAIHLARSAAASTDQTTATDLDTLAAAYAAAGRFDQAIATAQAALDQATADAAQQHAGQIRQRLKMYRQSRPYRRPLSRPGPNDP